MKAFFRRPARFSSLFHLSFAVFHAALGITGGDVWFLFLGAYYAILSAMHIGIARLKTPQNTEDAGFLRRFVGAMLLLLALCLAATVWLDAQTLHGTVYHEIVMITIALYSFLKLSLAIARLCRIQKTSGAKEQSAACVFLCDALFSILSLQRSMLLSFEGMTLDKIRLMNLLTGIGVCLFTLSLALVLLNERKFYHGKIKSRKNHQKN